MKPAFTIGKRRGLLLYCGCISLYPQIMQDAAPQEITRLLLAWRAGDAGALEALTPLVYQELHRLAHRHLGREQPGEVVMQTSALVNEAYLRLGDAQAVDWQNRAHFFGISARLMRQILVDFARTRASQKRGGEAAIQVSLALALDTPVERPLDLVALDDALLALSKLNARQSQIIELRFFGGLSVEETAEVLHVSPSTVLSDWRTARAWLHRELAKK
jgi:RNA polymerase sigma factor (TIGR02999 family)